MPTGVALRDARAQLLAAAERILHRAGPGALTSRAITDEAGVSKGVLHRHFNDVDDLILALVEERAVTVARWSAELCAQAGSGTLVGNVCHALSQAIDPVAVGLIGLAISRDELRNRLRRSGRPGLPTVGETTAMLSAYLTAERDLGRLAPHSDPEALAHNLVGTGHLVIAGELGAPPEPAAITEVVETALGAALPGQPGSNRPRDHRPEVSGS